jgi:SAM-dependent methyltransferase
MYEGLGTTYERFILHRYFQILNSKYTIKNVLEVPAYGMTGIPGINSMWWALNGVQVTVVDDDEQRTDDITNSWKEVGLDASIVFNRGNNVLEKFEDRLFDMSWNFASLWYVSDIEKLFVELTRVTRKVIFICVPNRANIGYWFRKGRLKREGLNLENIKPARIVSEMERLNWKLDEKGYFDVPPWPDIAMKKEELLEKIGLKWFAMKLRKTHEDGMCILDYYSGKKKNIEDDILKYSFLENVPQPFKGLWAHHRYFIFTPKRSKLS